MRALFLPGNNKGESPVNIKYILVTKTDMFLYMYKKNGQFTSAKFPFINPIKYKKNIEVYLSIASIEMSHLTYNIQVNALFSIIKHDSFVFAFISVAITTTVSFWLALMI